MKNLCTTFVCFVTHELDDITAASNSKFVKSNIVVKTNEELLPHGKALVKSKECCEQYVP